MIWDKTALANRLSEWSRRGIPLGKAVIAPLKLHFYIDDENIFNYIDATQEITITSSRSNRFHDIISSLDRCGFFNVVVTHLSIDGSSEMNRTSRSDFAEWFLRMVTPFEMNYLYPDTSLFISKHYFSNILYPLLDDSFSSLRFFIPRLVVLEIERKCNQSKRGSKERRLSYYATKELMFLKRYGALLLPSVDVELLSGFTKIAGSRLNDTWIRQEIRRRIDERGVDPEFNIFLTGDLMNALAAQAEGIRTLYFSRIDQEQFHPRDYSHLSQFIIDAAVTFGKIRVEVYLRSDTVEESYQLEGIWPGKTPYHWLNESLRVERIC